MKRLLAILGLRNSAASQTGEAKAVLAQIIEEIVAVRREQNTGWDGVKSLKDSARWRALMEEPREVQVSVALAALAKNKRGMSGGGGWDYWLRRDIPFSIARLILQKKSIKISEEDLVRLVNKATQTDHLEYQFPVSTVLGACERHLAEQAPTKALRRALEAFVRRTETEGHATQAVRKMGIRAKAMLNPNAAGGAASLPSGAFSKKLMQWVGKEPSRVALASHLNEAFDKSKPTKTWLKEGAARTKLVSDLWDQLSIWLESEVPDPSKPDMSLDLLKSLIWLAPPEMAPQIGRFCQVCFKKVPQIGARSIKLGNACLLALEGMGTNFAAVAELSRLLRDIKYASVRDQIAQRLARVAKSAGLDVTELEDRSLPDFGLNQEGYVEVALERYCATLRVTALETKLAWRSSNGKELKSIPKQVRENHPETLKALKSKQKDIENARKATVARLEASWVDSLDWDLEEWRTLFEQHPVRRQITRSLIWQLTCGDATVSGLPSDAGWVGPDGAPVELPEKARVSLWHPLNCDPETVLSWRRNIIQAGLTQPIKQVYREVYVLTEAERQTEVYSNRFAAHILRQHQFKALCDARGWRFNLMGAHFDGHNIPERPLPSLGLKAEYTVEVVEDGQASETGISSHVATDQVSFLDTENNRVPLTEVEPIVFSELMREVDLFVAVSSVANDPAWTDGGPEGRFGRYWHEHAFGDLSQSAQSRKELLEDILPSLAIAQRCSIEGKFLVVRGKLNDYVIHLGSSNIQIRPSNRYLCIVPGRRNSEATRLPFAGDGTFSIILSKAYMLIDDDKIIDKTILAQLSH
ncbi:DUF4132 domain-containing protein [Neptunicoccus cionae]|uniref:DUF4132 domain-containing protein n=1 Tax=Neptunicoccus cionae TaxID=2035344 RepID=A0A916R4P7_9RHOB|nr:DUF4132 domain-containing protein [Amylibacter cionae]GGA33680.1 hypothetical protein GCM10011498_38620 [Amylibacter cionae]